MSTKGGRETLPSLPLLIRPPVLSGEDPTFIPSFDLNYLLNALSPTHWESGLQHMNFGAGGTQFSP